MQRSSHQISPGQAVAIVVIAIIGSATLIVPGGMIKEAAQDAWLSGLVAMALTLFTGGLWLWLASLWPGRDLFDLVLAAGGRWLGGLIIVLLLLWFYLILTGAVWIGTDTILTVFLPETPRLVLSVSILAPAAYAAHSRHEVIARLSHLSLWAIVLLLLLLIPLSGPSVDFKRLAPPLAGGVAPVWRGALRLVGILSENMVLVTLLPAIRKPVRPWRLLVLATVIAAGMVTVLNLWTVTIFGPKFPARFQYPVLLLAHIISVGDVIERLDALIMALWIAGVVAKAGLWYWLLCRGLARLLGLRSSRTLVWPFFLLLIAGTLTWVENSPAYPGSLRAWTVLFTPPIALAVPLILLAVTAFVRRREAARV